MHMRRSLIKKYHLRKRVVEKDKEGGSVVSYEAAVPIRATIWPASGKIQAEAVEIEAIIWPAGGKVQAEMYGERLAYIKNMEYEGKKTMREGDGICVFVDPESDPDYKIISIKEYSPMLMELEKI